MLLAGLLVLGGCASGGGGDGGRYAMSRDAYPDNPPDVADVPDAVPRVEPLAASGNRSTYRVWGKTYHVLPSAEGYEAEGTASWYGEKFQGYDTASGESYDMYKMSAAHRSLPLPTYARVTNTDNGRSVIVKVNDRGPFHGNRLIDLSYAAAARLGILRTGTGHVRVEAIDPVAWQARHRSGSETSTSRSLASRQASSPDTRARRDAASGADSAASTQALATRSAPTATAMPTSGASGARAEKTTASRAAETGTSATGTSATGTSATGTSATDPVAGDSGAFYLQVAALNSATNARKLRERLQSRLDRPVRIDSDARLHRVQVGPVADRSALEALRQQLRDVGYAQTFAVTAGN
nr:septal ring lytic transglycosylase RlpA family protein [Halomonas coralii]